MHSELFENYGTQLKKVAWVFTRKSNHRIEFDEFFQEFAVRLIELNKRYTDLPKQEFKFILNRSLHNLGVDVLKSHSKLVYVDPNELPQVLQEMKPSFDFYYKQAIVQVIKDTKAKEIFGWLMENTSSVGLLRIAKNEELKRQRDIAISDIVDTIKEQFQISRCKAQYYFRVIKDGVSTVLSKEVCY